MKLDVVDDPKIVYENLNTACSLNAPADIRVFKGKIAYTYKSRLYEIRGTGGKRSVAIDIPTWDGHFVALRRGCQMEVHFAVRSERFMFEAKLLGKSAFNLAGGNKVQVLVISYPRTLESGQRRAYFRVSPPSSQQISVRMAVSKGPDDDKWTYEDRREAVRSQVMNICAGGIGVRVPKSVAKNMSVGTRLKLAFRLEEEEEKDEIKLVGTVRNVRDDFADKGMRVVGIQFIHLDDSPEATRQVDRIWKYVADIQRKELAATRGGT